MIFSAEQLRNIATCAHLSERAYDDKIHFGGYDSHFIENKETDTQVHILLGENIYIAYRGTESLKDALQDAKVIRNLEGIHSGVYEAFMSIRDDLENILHQELRSKDRKVFLTGHSLGGALALVNEKFLSNMINSEIVTFGALMVFNSAASCFHIKNYTRVENKLDPVPRLPGDKLGYVNPYGKLLWIDLFNNLQESKPWWADKFGFWKPHHRISSYAKFFKAIVNDRNFNDNSYINI